MCGVLPQARMGLSLYGKRVTETPIRARAAEAGHRSQEDLQRLTLKTRMLLTRAEFQMPPVERS